MTAGGYRAVVALLSLLAVGCDVEPYCISCPGAGMDGGVADAAGRDASTPDAGQPDDGAVIVDASGDAGCEPGAEEECNGADDDCDGSVDEGFDTRSDPAHCGGCGVRCAPAHAFGGCTDGVCGIAACDVPWHDIDGDPSNGCEYRCLALEIDDVLCNLRDDDCDMRIDEDVDLATDPTNCGACGHVCRLAHATAACSGGACGIAMCDPGYTDRDGMAATGCEVGCTPRDPPVEICNSRDDDCDGMIDEGDPEGGGVCGSDVGECSSGIERCVAGAVVCAGGISAATEICNGRDDDCDGTADEGDPEGGRVCGTSVGVCVSGRETCLSGALVCSGATEPGLEACNALDDDCDGSVDEGNPGGGAACGSDTGECSAGVMVCTGGSLACGGGVGPAIERCNGLDDDCDGAADEDDPEGGGLCGTDVGECAPGTRRCTAGTLVCIGEVGPGAERCNGLDDDCDGRIDQGNPEGGAACGPAAVGECRRGTATCVAGALACTGTVGPRTEACNGLDDDCDATVDEGFALATDPRNCGACGRVCSFSNATATCTGGVCVLGACVAGFHDLDGSPDNGCEYRCDVTGAEICNGRDDDCDGATDEALVPPASFCNPNGVCAGTTASCGGSMGWQCAYPASFESSETRCDGLDNDCDGSIDEPYPLRGTSCANGAGACRRTGTFVCNGAGTGLTCTAPPAGAPASEACNNADDDCDGRIDEPGADDPGTPWRDAIDVTAIDTVLVDRASGGTMRMMAYEASRPDASATAAGGASHLACSRGGVLPWTNVTWTQARDACCALNASGTCPAPAAPGWRLCDAPDWQRACEGPARACDWSYQTMCATSQRTTCNGEEYDCNPGMPGDQDCLFATGAATFSSCHTDWASGGRVFDLSGNVREWTGTARAAGRYEARGGAYTNVEAGRACDFDFVVLDTSFEFENTGFRCCLY